MTGLPGRLRDATVQVVADAVDARWGVSCFALARGALCVHVAGVLSLGYLLDVGTTASRTDVVVTLCLAAYFGVTALAKVAYLAHFERRVASSGTRAVIPIAGDALTTLMGFALGAACATLDVRALSGCARAFATGHHPPGGPVVSLAWTVTILAMTGLPAGMLLAGCEWRRLHRPGERVRPAAVPQAV